MKLACDAWEARAQGGDATAQVALADCYLKGNGRERDLARAEQWLRLAIEQQDPRAMNDLAGLLLFRKDSASVDEKREAVQLLSSAAEDGAYNSANFPLGLAYWSGLGTQQDTSRAVKHFRIAADSDHLLATFALSCIYNSGLRGIEADATLAASRRMSLETQLTQHGFSTLEELAKSALADPFVRQYLFTPEEIDRLNLCIVKE